MSEQCLKCVRDEVIDRIMTSFLFAMKASRKEMEEAEPSLTQHTALIKYVTQRSIKANTSHTIQSEQLIASKVRFETLSETMLKQKSIINSNSSILKWENDDGKHMK